MSAAQLPSFNFVPLSIKGVQAQRLDSPYIRLFTVVNFLFPEECTRLIQAIDRQVDKRPTPDARGIESLHRHEVSLHASPSGPAASVESRISELLGLVSSSDSEPLQGVKYYEQGFYGAHYDWFNQNNPQENSQIQSGGGQRSWTFMVYLNNVEKGGETRFDKLGIQFQPSAGLALCWRNLLANGEVNQNALHSALPVLKGTKYIVTKWFREASTQH